jgi:hypothetical protein
MLNDSFTTEAVPAQSGLLELLGEWFIVHGNITYFDKRFPQIQHIE